MSKRTFRKIINWVMIVSLVVVMSTGMLLKPMPGMVLGILHGVSGFTLTISIIIHCIQHRVRKNA